MTFIRFLLISLSLSLIACSRSPELQTISGFAQGTTYHIAWWSSHPVDSANLQQAITNRLTAIDINISGYRADSTIEQFNAEHNTDAHNVGNDIVALVKQAQHVSHASQGCYDITIAPLFELWGFRHDVFSPPTDSQLQHTLQQVGMDKLQVVDTQHLRKVIPTLRIDLSSIGQGYSVGQIAQVLERAGIENYLVEIGGELQTRGAKPGNKPWRIALEKPLAGDRKVEKIITIHRHTPLAVMTSGTYRHYFDRAGVRYSHILDARNGRPVQHDTLSVTVLHSDPTIADAWSTALLCLGLDAGLPIANQQGIAALFIRAEGRALHETASIPWQTLQAIELE